MQNLTPYPLDIKRAAEEFGTPHYFYSQLAMFANIDEVLSMPNAFGLTVRYAMKANSNGRLVQMIHRRGCHIDASSINEVKRAVRAYIPISEIMLTSQEVPSRKEFLKEAMEKGMKYNVCSLTQLENVMDLAEGKNLSIRVHPGVGSGESATRDTGSPYSCFGVHLTDVPIVLEMARTKNIKFDTVHTHIGSGGNPQKWRENIDRVLGFVEEYFPDATRVSFGGGLKEARMPYEERANIQDLGDHAALKLREFNARTNRKLHMEIEPGTFIIANVGYMVTKVIDKKQTGTDGFEFLVCDGGMEINARPLMYGSKHPFYVISKDGSMLSSEFQPDFGDKKKLVVVGRCCESGDSQGLDAQGNIVPRLMADPDIGDYVVIGGTGAYGSSMTPFNYNSHLQAPEVLQIKPGELELIRRKQTMEQMLAAEECNLLD